MPNVLGKLQQKPQNTLWSDGDHLWLRVPYAQRGQAQRINGARYMKKPGAWKIPLLQLCFKTAVALFPQITIEPGTRESMDRLRTKYLDVIAAKDRSMKEPNEGLRDFLELPFFEHQLKNFTFYKDQTNCADFSEPGAGKTMVQIALMKHRWMTKKANKFLIVCPLATMWKVWDKDIRKFWGKNHPIINVLDKSVNYVESVLTAGMTDGIFIINYEKTWRVLPLLLKVGFDMVILDESQRIKNPTSKQTKACLKLNEAPFRSILTGTPTPNNEMEIYPQWKFLEWPMVGDNFYAFRDRYFERDPYVEYVWHARDNTNIKLKAIIDVYSVSWKKKDCLSLPPFTSQHLECLPNAQQKKTYNEMAKEMVTLLNEDAYDASIVLTKMLRLSQITSGFIQNTDGADFQEFTPNAKLNLLMETIKGIPKDKQIIIWAVFHNDYRVISQALEQAEITHAMYYGGVSKKLRETGLNEFLAGSKRVFIANPRSAGLGINLSNSSYCIRYSMNYSYEDYAQSVERFNRTGQKFPMTEYILIMKGTIDEAIANSVLKEKKSINNFMTSFKEVYSHVR